MVLSIKPILDYSDYPNKFSFLYSLSDGKWVSPEYKYNIFASNVINELAVSIVAFIKRRYSDGYIDQVVIVSPHIVAQNENYTLWSRNLKSLILRAAKEFNLMPRILFDSSYNKTDEKEGQDKRIKERRATMAEKLELDQSIARAVSMKFPDAVYIGVSDIDSGEIFFHAEGRLPNGTYTVVNPGSDNIIKSADGKYLRFDSFSNHWYFLTAQDFNTAGDYCRFNVRQDDEAKTNSNPDEDTTPDESTTNSNHDKAMTNSNQSETSVQDTPPTIPSPSPKKIRRARFLTPWQKKTIDKLEGKIEKNDKYVDDSMELALFECLFKLLSLGTLVGLSCFIVIFCSKDRGSQKSSSNDITYESAMSEWEGTLESEKTSSQDEQKGTGK